jgi:hypothetical protein
MLARALLLYCDLLCRRHAQPSHRLANRKESESRCRGDGTRLHMAVVVNRRTSDVVRLSAPAVKTIVMGHRERARNIPISGLYHAPANPQPIRPARCCRHDSLPESQHASTLPAFPRLRVVQLRHRLPHTEMPLIEFGTEASERAPRVAQIEPEPACRIRTKANDVAVGWMTAVTGIAALGRGSN